MAFATLDDDEEKRAPSAISFHRQRSQTMRKIEGLSGRMRHAWISAGDVPHANGQYLRG